MASGDLIFRQLFDQETWTYTYLLADPKTREAVLIDAVLEQTERDLKLIDELGLRLKYVLDTHVHADHVTAAGEIGQRTGAKAGISSQAAVDCADIALKDGDTLKFGEHELSVLETPGHTNSCLSFVVGDRVFTGDALTIRGAGRTDFQEGSSEKLFESIRTKLFRLPLETRVYPGHDYRGLTESTIAEEMTHNPRIGLKNTKEQFMEIMAQLKLAAPKKIHIAVPANLGCGSLAKEGGPQS